MDPEIIFLDEPFSNLDPESYADILQIVQAYRKKGLTIIVATHDVDVLPDLVDNCILLDKGEMIAERNVRDMLTDYVLLSRHKMRMPLLGLLFHNLKQRNVIQDPKLPLTLEQAESLVEKLLKSC